MNTRQPRLFPEKRALSPRLTLALARLVGPASGATGELGTEHAHGSTLGRRGMNVVFTRTRDMKTRLRDIRQIGPDSERDISGICSECGTALLARVDTKMIPSRSRLEEALRSVFIRHTAEQHEEGPSGVRAPTPTHAP
jgi:hypothetical protein